MNIVLWKTPSETKAITRTKTTVATLSGTLKSPTDILNPVITIESDIETINKTNMVEITEFYRYYFITGIRAISNILFELTLHIDVLYTYSNWIKAQNAIVKSQENNWNLYINDGTFTTYQNPIVLTKSFPTGFTTQSYVLAVAGNSNSPSGQ